MAQPNMTRRGLLGSTAAGAAVLPTLAQAAPAAGSPGAAASGAVAADGAAGVPMLDVVLQINGRRTPLQVEPRAPLLDVLREQIGLTGTKKGCGRGSCGACTVHIDGQRVLSCLTLASRCHNKAVTTIEGLAHGTELHPMQAAFVKHDAFQCGYCTPGQIMSATACVEEGHAKNDATVREWMSGNLCRCGAYPNILAAIRDVAGAQGG